MAKVGGGGGLFVVEVRVGLVVWILVGGGGGGSYGLGKWVGVELAGGLGSARS